MTLPALVVVSALTLGACGGSQSAGPPQTARVEPASISTGVESSGSVSALGATNLGFSTGGQLTSVRVSVGDQVTPGQIVATIDDFNARQQLRNAQSQLAAQEANYNRVKDGTAVGGAQNSVDAAASVVSATRRQADATLRSDDAAISAARAAIPQAQAGLAQAQAALAADIAACQPTYPTTPPAPCQKIPADQYGVQSAQQGVQTVQQQLLQAQQKRNVDAAAGNLQVASARQGQVSAQNGLDSASADRPNTLDAAAAAVDGARTGVAQAQKALDNTTLRAPAAGTVSALNGVVGEYVAPSSSTTPLAPGADAPIPGAAQAAGGAAGTATGAASPTRPGGTQFLVLQNVARFAVVVPFQEVDAAKIAPQQRTTVSLDAIPDRTFDGTVLSVAPSSTAIGGSVEYYVTIALPSTDPRVHDGQSAQATVITSESDQKISVPNSALHRQGDKATVTVVEPDGRQVPTPVTTGLVGADRTEITSGLSQGQQVLLGGGA
ncbi:MAG TPA: HlyD family efflux transporter periplasmic adaptor subunit [Actinomycetospora sp.]|jgi:HlyD family secretion protein|uniref:efflux RND transporter periplasmic adaptor subunit n=1 Tax=Actinomycetospora sp. TaxID=1872135 RepID=UPI002F3F3C30